MIELLLTQTPIPEAEESAGLETPQAQDLGSLNNFIRDDAIQANISSHSLLLSKL